jgi:hypothetical protein
MDSSIVRDVMNGIAGSGQTATGWPVVATKSPITKSHGQIWHGV